jgi:phosphohistidine phosphatase
MARSLLLMRHAKSDWNNGSLTDKARPLNQRGRAAAPAMAKWLLDSKLLPSTVICSSAARTQQTLELMIHFWNSQSQEMRDRELPETRIVDELYLASDETILSIVCNDPSLASIHCVLVLGHNPGMEMLASKLSGLSIAMPTGAIAALDSNFPEEGWPTDWSSSKMWKWRGLVKPRELGTETI